MNNRPFASLSPTLLARKGAARPAMRPQLQPLRQFHENTSRHLDDLGWNDIGHDDGAEGAAPAPVDAAEAAKARIVEPQPEAKPAEPKAAEPKAAELKPAEPRTAEIVAFAPAAEPAIAYDTVPEVVRQQEAIAERIARPRRSALTDGRRAAFTLRLDGERHLKLRLACVTSNRSAQQLVTEALDRLLAELPDVAEMAAKLGKRS